MAWTITPSQTAAPSLIRLSEFLNSVKNGALDIIPHAITLQLQCDNCRSDNSIERVLFVCRRDPTATNLRFCLQPDLARPADGFGRIERVGSCHASRLTENPCMIYCRKETGRLNRPFYIQ